MREAKRKHDSLAAINRVDEARRVNNEAELLEAATVRIEELEQQVDRYHEALFAASAHLMIERDVDAALQVVTRALGSVVHLVGLKSGPVTECCGYSPLELPSYDRLTTDRRLVTCGGE